MTGPVPVEVNGRTVFLPPDFVGDCVITDNGGHLEVTWPNGRGVVLVSPEILEEAVRAINRIRSRDSA